MNLFARRLALLVLVASCAVHAPAQPPPAGVQTTPPAEPREFVSLTGRFRVALPRRPSGFSGITSDTPSGRVTVGDKYTWSLPEAHYEIGHVDPIDPAAAPHLSSDGGRAFIDRMAEAGAAFAAERGGKLLSNTQLSLAGHYGREVVIEFPDQFFVTRIFVVGSRLYQAAAGFRKDADARASVKKALDSFAVLSPAEAEAALRRKVEEATPAPLPQGPAAARRPKSDAEDEGLRGRVKTVVTESQDLSGTWSVQRRKPSSAEHYDERGYLTKRESYDYKGNPADVTVYGYVGGERVSKTGSVEYEYNPPPPAKVAAPAGPEPKRDARYTYLFKFKYDERGRLTEKALLHNDGTPWLRYVYNYKGNQREGLVYSADGSLNQKYLVTLDEKGNEIEEVTYEVKDGSVRGRQSYAYEFDAQGNWTKKTVSKWVTKDGRSYFEPSHVYYRTITYH